LGEGGCEFRTADDRSFDSWMENPVSKQTRGGKKKTASKNSLAPGSTLSRSGRIENAEKGEDLGR